MNGDDDDVVVLFPPLPGTGTVVVWFSVSCLTTPVTHQPRMGCLLHLKHQTQHPPQANGGFICSSVQSHLSVQSHRHYTSRSLWNTSFPCVASDLPPVQITYFIWHHCPHLSIASESVWRCEIPWQPVELVLLILCSQWIMSASHTSPSLGSVWRCEIPWQPVELVL